MDHAVFEASQRYDLAAIAMQSENAAEVAKAKAAEKEALMIKRAEDEDKREEELQAKRAEEKELLAQREEVLARIEQIKGDYEFSTDDEKNELLAELTEAKEKVKTLLAEAEAAEKEGGEIEARHQKERAAIKQADKVAEEKEKADAEFNERATNIVEAFNELGSKRDEFEKKM